MTKRSSVSGASSTGKSTPTPSMAQSPTPSSRAGAQYNNSPSPQSQLRYQPPPSPPLTPSSSHERIPPSTSFSSTTVSLSNSISSIPDTSATVHSSPEPIGVRLKPLDTSTSTASVDTAVSGRSSTYMASSISSVSGLDSEDGSTEAGRNRRSETTMVEMWPSSSPSSALARKPVNGSRLALAMQPPTDSEESDEEEMTNGLRRAIGGSDEEYDPDDGGWATHGGTLPLQVVKINTPNSMPPSPYQAFPSSSPRVQSDSDSDVFQSRSGSVTQTDSSRLHDETDSDSEYNTTDPEEEEMPEDHDDETTKFAVPSERQSVSPTPNHGTANHHPATSISGSAGSQTFARASSSSHNGSMLYGDTSHSLMHEESTRLSIAAPSFQGSEDGEVGIGLSLLQGLLGGDDEGSDSDSDQAQDQDQDQDETPSADVAPEHEQDGSSSRRQSVISAVRGPPPPGEDWDTASDIYEDYYRFSRFSTNPRSSTSTFASSHKMPARFSQSSHRGIPGPSTSAVPPVPTDSRGEAESHRGPKTRSIDSDASVYTQASKRSFIDPSRLSAQPPQSRRPTPLELIGVNGEPSPLLHTRWGSPLSSPSPPPSSSATQSSFIDAGTPPASASSGSISPGGAASVLRQQLESDRGSPIGSYTNMEAHNDPAHGGLGSRIVIEDDEELPVPAITDEPRSLSPEDEPEAETDDDSRRRPGFEDLAPLVISNTLSPPPDPTASTSPQSPSTATPLSPSSPPDLPPPPSQTPQQSQQSQHQSRPSLSELRGYAGHDSSSKNGPFDKSRQRTSVFLPHPNAPKPPPPTGAAEGPLYIRAAPPPSQQRSENVVNVIKMSIGRSTVTRVMPTIYGRTDVDLASATGPVRVVFSIDPLPPLSIPLPSQIPFRNGAAPPRRKLTESDPGHVGQSGSPPGPPRAPAPPGRSLSATASPVSAVPSKSSPLAEKPAPASVVIPRPNFFPKAGTSRPRSRSFSGFNTGREISAPIR
ncbi:hypothetical protein C8R47DRAFT_482744 [Mycena vitilis]|nr:hypothetical protein C8R47DRAFT_482744 [Mycena vitilis]